LLKKLFKAPVIYVFGPLFIILVMSGIFYLIVFFQSPMIRNVELYTSGMLLHLENEDFIESRNIHINGTLTRYLFGRDGWPRNSSRFNGTFTIDDLAFTTTGGTSFFIDSITGSPIMAWIPEDITGEVSTPPNIGQIFSESNFRRFVVLIHSISVPDSGNPGNLIFVYPATNMEEAVFILQEFTEESEWLSMYLFGSEIISD